MRASEILASFTGFSIPIFGIQWQPAMPEVTTARHLILEMEDRRVLFREHELEGINHCIQSVDQIRSVLTASLKQVSEGSELFKRLRKMRTASRNFCDVMQAPTIVAASETIQRSVLRRELYKLRGIFGQCIGEMSIGYSLDVDDELASIIPFKRIP